MKVLGKDITEIKEPLIVSIGFFDGVHKGHRFLLQQLKDESRMRSLASAVVTFKQHPREVLHSSFQPSLLCSYDEKLELLAETGIDYCIPIDFTSELSQLTAKDFMLNILKNQFNTKALLIGYDHRFGFNRTDGFAEYIKHGRDMEMVVIQAKELDTGEYISSSHIRRLLDSGEVEKVAHELTYNYCLSGEVIHGDGIGRTIGFPTANIKLNENLKVVPQHGVYAVYVHTDNAKYKGMLYIGKRATMHDNREISIEVNIFDFDQDIYGKNIKVELLRFMRKDAIFQNIEILIKQLQYDEDRVRKYLAEKK